MSNALNIPEQYLSALVEVSAEINSIQNLESLLSRILEIAIKQLSAERGFVLLKEGEDEELVPKASRTDESGKSADSSEISSTAIESVIKAQKPILTFDALTDEQFDQSHSVVMQKIRSIACVPLEIKGTLIGAIYIDSRGQKARFNQKSLDFLAAFANQAGIAIENARLLASLRQENEVLKEEVKRIYSFKELVGSSKSMQPVFDIIKKVLDNSTTVLIVGETGTGKELIARAVHYNGMSKDSPFIPVNCAALPENLLESELYGYKKGAFTGATADKKGLIEVANSGTLFLDEIAEIPMSLQAKLLRFLQEKEIMPIGGAFPKKVDVRIIAATNRNLADEVRDGRFREDLYYRLSIIPIELPPLRERKSDIPLLAEHFLQKFSTATGKRLDGFAPDVMGSLQSYGWPGNVRELENAIERAVVLSSGEQIQGSDVIVRGIQQQDRIDSGMTLDDVSRILLLKTLRSCEGNKTHTAEMMGVSLRWVHYKTKEWDIQD